MTTEIKKNVPYGSNISVPQELVDYTLDFLHDDIPTLRLCSVVSRAFLPCSRYHIYSNVFIAHVAELYLFQRYTGQLYQYQNLAALVEHSPHVALLVTRFGIHGKPQWMTNILLYPSLFPIIQSLRNLSHLELIARSRGEVRLWATFPVETHSLFLAALRSLPLKTLILKGFNCHGRNARFEDACNAVAANPALKHLSLQCCCQVETSRLDSPIRPPLSGLPALESLSISGSDAARHVAWMFFTQSLYSVSSIRRLALQVGRPTNSSVIQNLLDEMQETLESLTLVICPGEKVDFDLSRHRNLSCFYTVVTDSSSLEYVPRMRLSPALRKLTVEHVSRIWEWKSPRPARPWAEVDRLDLPALEHVRVRLHDALLDRCYYDAECYTCKHPFRAEYQADPGDLNNWKRQVEESMPFLKERGILEVEVVKQRHSVSEGFD